MIRPLSFLTLLTLLLLSGCLNTRNEKIEVRSERIKRMVEERAQRLRPKTFEEEAVAEMERRQRDLDAYLSDTDPARAGKYGFRKGHTPALAWNWFSEHPIGYGGVPYVLLQTILSIDPAKETDPELRRLGAIWHKPSRIESEKGQKRYTLDHLGFGPHPDDYAEGVAKAPAQRSHRLPNGFVYDPEVKVEEVSDVEDRQIGRAHV